MPIDRAILRQALETAFNDTVLRIDAECKKQISAVKWSWPKGESPRDIVDTGRLRSSQTIVPLADRNGVKRAMISWPVTYAAAVHEGAVFQSGRSMPARPWTREALKSFDAVGFFTQRYLQALNKTGRPPRPPNQPSGGVPDTNQQ